MDVLWALTIDRALPEVRETELGWRSAPKPEKKKKEKKPEAAEPKKKSKKKKNEDKEEDL